MNDHETPREHIFRDSLCAEEATRHFIENVCSSLPPGVLNFELSQELQEKGVDFTLYVNGTRITLQLKSELRPCNSFLEHLQFALDKGIFKSKFGNIQTTTADYYLTANLVSGYLILVDRWGWAEFGQCQLTRRITDNPSTRLLYAVANISRNSEGKRVLSRVAYGHPVSNVLLLSIMRRLGFFFRIFDIRGVCSSEQMSLKDHLVNLKYPRATPSKKSLDSLKVDIDKGANDYLEISRRFDVQDLSRLPDALLSLKPSANAGRLILGRGREIIQSAASFSITTGGDDYVWPTIPIGPADESVAAEYGAAPIVFARPSPP